MKRYKIPLKIFEIPGGGNHLLVKAKINTIATYLLIDTGASSSVFDIDSESFEQTSIIPVEEDMQSSGFNSSIDNLSTGEIESLKISHFKTKIPLGIFTSLEHVNQLYKSIKLPKISGIIGSYFLIKHNAIINFSTKILSLEKK